MRIRNDLVQLLEVYTRGHLRWFDGRRVMDGCDCRLVHFPGGWCAFGTEMRANLVSKVVIERTGVGFLVRNADLGQIVNDYITLHFQFACQFVDSDLTHA